MAAPDDPNGTVRAVPGALAVRAPNSDPESDELSWYVIDIGGSRSQDDDIEEQLAVWPIVYQPAAHGTTDRTSA